MSYLSPVIADEARELKKYYLKEHWTSNLVQ